ncbi:hypothetical protein V6N13_048513 [Hibiscus sabdariffa]
MIDGGTSFGVKIEWKTRITNQGGRARGFRSWFDKSTASGFNSYFLQQNGRQDRINLQTLSTEHGFDFSFDYSWRGVRLEIRHPSKKEEEKKRGTGRQRNDSSSLFYRNYHIQSEEFM